MLGLTGQPGEIAVTEQVIVSIAGIVESAKKGLLALAVGTGLQVMATMFAEDAEQLGRPMGKHNPVPAGYRHGSEAVSVTLGGRRIPVTRPRLRVADGPGSCTCRRMTCSPRPRSSVSWRWRRMLAGLSSRGYTAGLEPAGQVVEAAVAVTGKSPVSRRFAAATETALTELMSRRLDDLDLVALTIDGVHFGEHTCVVALGIGIDETMHLLAVEQSSTENATLSPSWSPGCAGTAWTSPRSSWPCWTGPGPVAGGQGRV